MEEYNLKKKNILDKIIHNQTLITCATIMVVAFIAIGASYALIGGDDEIKEVNISIGNMQAVLNGNTTTYFLDKDTSLKNDITGMNQDGYSFTLTNTGNIDIDYYEIRLINQENKDSTIPHKYIRYSIMNSIPVSLGLTDDIIYYGESLKVGEKNELNLKLWIDENEIHNVLNKKMYGALEVTLYQKKDIFNNYILYNVNGGETVYLRSNINNPITSYIPIRNGYEFLGWSSQINGEVEYESGANYLENSGKTLYAVWKLV